MCPFPQPSKVVEVVTLLSGIWVVPGSNLGRDAYCHNGCFALLKVNAGIVI